MSRKNLLDSIEVPSPCSESWNEMTGSETVRFCSHCAKDVHNISKMTRKKARKIIAASNGNLCIRAIRKPDGTIQTLKRQFAQITRQTGVAASVLGASVSLSTIAAAQTTTADSNNQIIAVARANQKADQPNGTVSGTITDPNGAVVPFALVTLSNTFFYQTANTDEAGFYEFKDVPAGDYKLKVEAGNFEPKEFAQIFVSGDTAQNAQLNLQNVQEVVQVGTETVNVDSGGFGGVLVSTLSFKRSKLIEAVESNDIEKVIVRIRKGDRVNAKDKGSDGNTALHVAVENGNAEIARYLLSAGAKINSKNYEKRTPLMMLDEDANAELVNVLLGYNPKIANVDAAGNTALHFAAESADKEAIQLLVGAGANLDQQNRDGRTALMNAVENNNVEAVKILLGAGANVNIVDAKGETAWTLAASDEIKQWLVSYNAAQAQTTANN